MSVLDIVTWPDARLTAVCAPVATRTPEIDQLIADMNASIDQANAFILRMQTDPGAQ